MWVSRAKWRAMEGRLSALENKPVDRERLGIGPEVPHYTRGEPFRPYTWGPENTISLSTAVEMLAKHVGVQFTWEKGVSPRAALKKVPRK
jgi:hypothetical protein